ncbi:hypothetical protein PAPYR_4755 [Paratrimastix pyriformis]|uniref:Uncharacterized protein n=1 Tax=Paratrimastix pyriformis TaxID=342808 RepID=A0ABQ8UPG9_9EUKA|nr:hypothetical protein PAPYR_4755 [Paratrimastix pyriformis]
MNNISPIRLSTTYPPSPTQDCTSFISGEIKEITVMDNIWVAGSRWKVALKKREQPGDESSVGVYLTRLYNAANPESYWMRDPVKGHQISLSMFLCRGGRYWKPYLIDNYNCTARKTFTPNRDEDNSVSGSFGFPMITYRDLQELGGVLRCVVSIEHLR